MTAFYIFISYLTGFCSGYLQKSFERRVNCLILHGVVSVCGHTCSFLVPSGGNQKRLTESGLKNSFLITHRQLVWQENVIILLYLCTYEWALGHSPFWSFNPWTFNRKKKQNKEGGGRHSGTAKAGTPTEWCSHTPSQKKNLWIDLCLQPFSTRLAIVPICKHFTIYSIYQRK